MCERAFYCRLKKQPKAWKMNLGLVCFLLGVVTSLSEAKSYSLPYKTDGQCRDPSTEYEVNDHCCSKCKPGTRKEKECTSTQDTVCVECPTGRYSDSMNYFPNCFSCRKCQEEKGLEYARQCTKSSNAMCVCKPGRFCLLFDESSTSCTSSCQKYKTCGPGKGASPGTPTEDVKCGSCPPRTFSNETSSQPCRPHTRCEVQGRNVLVQGTSKTDTVCGPLLSTRPFQTTTQRVPVTISLCCLSTEPSTNSTSHSNVLSVISRPTVDDSLALGLSIGLSVTALLLVVLITCFCRHHRKAFNKPTGTEAIEGSKTDQHSSPAENQGLLVDSSSDPSTSLSSDSHSQGTGVSQDCLHSVEQPPVSSPVVNLSLNLTATINCQVNPATASCSIPVTPCVPEPELPLSQEEELCVSCEQEDSKDAIQSVQECGMTKY